MIEIKIPKEIRDYKEKFLFGLTVRQCVSIAVALGICVPLYVFGKDFLGDDITSWLVILIAVPVFGFGFIKFNGMPFERFVAVLFRQKFVEPQKRKYVELPVFYEWRGEIISNEIARQNAAIKYRESQKKRKTKKAEDGFQKKALPPVPANTQKAGLSPSESERDPCRNAGKSEVEIPVFGGSLFVKYNKKKGCDDLEKDKVKSKRS